MKKFQLLVVTFPYFNMKGASLPIESIKTVWTWDFPSIGTVDVYEIVFFGEIEEIKFIYFS